jgi:hypothetical protein
MANKERRQHLAEQIETKQQLYQKSLVEASLKSVRPKSKDGKRSAVLNRILPLIPKDRHDSIINWIPTGKSEATMFRAMLQRAVFKYKVPPFCYSIFEDTTNYSEWRQLIINIGQGASAFKELKRKISILTRNQAHKMMCSTDKDLLRAYYLIVAEEVGLSTSIFNELEKYYKQPGKNLDVYLLETMTWFVRNPDLTRSEIGPISDYLSRQKPKNLLKRTVKSVRRAMEDWHEQTYSAEKNPNIPEKFPLSKLDNWVGTVTDSALDRKLSATVCEITTYTDLIKEGKTMKHCVASYAHSVASGVISIWRISIEGGLNVTLEVSNKEKTIRQARGKYNRSINVLERGVMNSFAKLNGLKISAYV